ncbi:unnamed protein product [Macrosiphum euphorbiae]|uniref:Uncharacterized protein n=1 Tax=Macrosiphum euphorbiae TaxID=13131 RepID=A0AAV0X395_9HEMI|nr:unnamed protein product [Macrosiphum euphorbiae]
MKFWFNHMVLVTIAIVFIVISKNAKNVQTNPVANNQSYPDVNNITSESSDWVFSNSAFIGAGLLISPVYRFNILDYICGPGYTRTSTGDCKLKFPGK